VTLKDQIAADRNTFLDLGEFAETHNIDGAEVTAILESHDLDTHTSDGVFLSEWILHVAEGAIETPVYSQRMDVDGDKLTVVHVGHNAGILAIRLQRIGSY
jgi:hypothetical protein